MSQDWVQEWVNAESASSLVSWGQKDHLNPVSIMSWPVVWRSFSVSCQLSMKHHLLGLELQHILCLPCCAMTLHAEHGIGQ